MLASSLEIVFIQFGLCVCVYQDIDVHGVVKCKESMTQCVGARSRKVGGPSSYWHSHVAGDLWSCNTISQYCGFSRTVLVHVLTALSTTCSAVLLSHQVHISEVLLSPVDGPSC